jgi:glycosyltransferase involved in cell wall biosynthesis
MNQTDKTLKEARPKVAMAVTNDLATDNRLQKIAQTLTKMGFSVTMTGRKFKHSLSVHCPGVASKRFSLWFNKGPQFYANYNLRLLFYLLCNKYDVFVANDLDTLPACYVAARLKRKPIVYDSHEYFTEVPELINRPRTQRIWEKIEKNIVPKLKHYYTVSQGIADIYNKKYNANFILVRNFPNKTSNEKQGKFHPPFPTDLPVVLYQGAINLGRGVEEAILAMKLLDNTRLVIVGAGDKFENCRQMVQNEDLSSKVILTGRITPDELSKITPFATIGLSIEKDLGLNYRFAMPNKLFNYIQAGVPVLASSLPEIKNIVNTYDVGFIIDETTPEKIATGVKHMLNSPAVMKRWKTNCKIAGESLCWENEEKTLKAIYQDFLPESL